MSTPNETRGDAADVIVRTRQAVGADALRRYHEEEELERVYDLRMLQRLWPFVRHERLYLWASLGLLLCMAVFGLVRPLVMRAALNGFLEPGGQERLTRYGLLLGGLIVVEQVIAFPQMYAVQIAGARGMARLRRSVFEFLHGCPLSFFDTTPIGRLVTRVTNDVDAIGEMFASGALNAVGDLLRLVVIVVILVSLDWKMSLFAFAVLPPVALGVDWTRRRMRTAYRQARARTSRMNAFLNEQVSGVGVVQAYAQEAASEAVFDEINAGYRAANMRAIVLDAAMDAALEMVSSICIAAILWYAGARKVSPAIEFGTLFAFVAYLEMFFRPVRDLSQRYTQIQSAMAGAERVFELLESGVRDAPASPDSRGEEGGGSWPEGERVAFALEGVTFGYKPGASVLHGVSIEARRGEVIAIVGPTGSGKSTVASLLLRLYEAREGVVRVFGRDVRDVDRQRLRRLFAVVPQDVFLFPGTVASNIAAGDPEPDLGRVQAVLDHIGARDLLDRREGLDTMVLERGSNFAAGERQLIAFARALYKNPPIVVLDEPTANIDSDTESRLQLAMNAAMEGRTALIIAHRLSTIRDAHRIVVLHHGAVVEQGTHDELVLADGVYARLHRLQAVQEKLERGAPAAQ